MDGIPDSGSSSTSESLLDILKEIKKEKVDNEDVYNIPFCELRKKQLQVTDSANHLFNGKNVLLNSGEHHRISTPANFAMVTKIKEEEEDTFFEYERIRHEAGVDYMNSLAKNYSLSNNTSVPSKLQESEAVIENLVLSVNIWLGQSNEQYEDGQIVDRVKLMVKISNRLLDEDITDGIIQTLPAGLGTSHGVYTTCFLPAGTVFEPYQESIMGEIQCTSEYWDVSKLNWMRFVRYTKDHQNQNLEMFQDQGQTAYRTICDILPGTELLLLSEKVANLDSNDLSKVAVSASVSSSPNRYPHSLLSLQFASSFMLNASKEAQKICSYACNIRGKECPSVDSLTQHMPVHIGGNRYVCTMCGKHFADAYSLKAHVRVHTGERPFMCKKCGKRFTQSSTLVRHMKTHAKPYECALCGKEFFQAIQLQRHIKLHNGEMPYECSECGKGYPTSSNLDYHMRTHTGFRPHRCAECGKRFIQPCQLKRHMLQHTGEKPYKCPVCSHRFTQSGHLRSHIRIHTGEKPHKCKTCGKMYKDSSSLRRHEQSHSGKLPYCCTVCEKRFCRSGDLTKHKIIHSDEKPYKCTVCDKAFRRSDRLLCHIRIHTGEKPYDCKICGKRFAINSDLKKHIMIHTGEKPLKCAQCEKRFRSHGDLKRHIRTHTGEKPYACDICNRVFCTLGNMKKHRKTHSNEKSVPAVVS